MEANAKAADAAKEAPNGNEAPTEKLKSWIPEVSAVLRVMRASVSFFLTLLADY